MLFLRNQMNQKGGEFSSLELYGVSSSWCRWQWTMKLKRNQILGRPNCLLAEATFIALVAFNLVKWLPRLMKTTAKNAHKRTPNSPDFSYFTHTHSLWTLSSRPDHNKLLVLSLDLVVVIVRRRQKEKWLMAASLDNDPPRKIRP